MSSENQNPLNQTGSNFPVIGRIKRVGEASAPKVQENFSNNEGDYFQNSDSEELPDSIDVQDLQTDVPPPSRSPGLQLKRNSGSKSGSEQHEVNDAASGVKIKNRTIRPFDNEENAQDSMAQFEGYFQQEEEKNQFKLLKKIFNLDSSFSAKARKIILGVALASLIFGIVISLNTFWLTLFFVLISIPAVIILSLQKYVLDKVGFFPSRIVFCVVLSLLFISIPIFYGYWQEQGVEYVNSFQKVENLANKAQDAIKDGVKKASAEVGEDVVTHDFKYSGGLAEKFHDATYLSGGNLFRMYLQYVFLLFGFILLPFIKERELLNPTKLKPDENKFQWTFVKYFMVRFIKGSLVTILITIGLKIGGIENVIFIGGITLLLASLTKMAGVVALILSIPSIIGQFNNGQGIKCVVILAVTALIVYSIEKHFYLFVKILPFKDKSFIPNELSQPKPAVIKVESSGGGGKAIFGLLSIAFYVVVFGALVFAGWKAYTVWADNAEIDKDIPEQVKKAAGDNKVTALAKLAKYRTKNPYNLEIIYHQTKAYAMAGEFTSALKAAKDYRDFKVPEPNATGFIEKGEQYLQKFLTNTNTKTDENKALTWLVENFKTYFPNNLDKEEVNILAEEMIKTQPKFAKSYELGANHAYLLKNYEAVRTWCARGMEVENENVELRKFIVKTHIAEGDKEKALKAMIEVDKVSTSDPEIDVLTKQIFDMPKN